MWYSVDTGCFVSGSFDGRVKIWDTNRLDVVQTIQANGPTYSVSMSKCVGAQSLVAVASRDENVMLVDLRTARGLHLLQGHQGSVFSVAWSPGNPNQLVTGSDDRSMRLWDIRRAGWVHSYNMSRRAPDQSLKTLSSHPSEVPFGERPGSVLDAPPIKRRKIDALEKAHDGRVVGVTFTPDSKSILSTGSDAKMRLWETETGVNEVVTYAGTKYKVPLMNRIMTSANGKLVYHPNGESIGVYEVKTGKKVHSLKGHYAPVTSMAYNATHAEMYSGAADGSILVWTPFLDELEILDERAAAAAEAADGEAEDEADFWDDSGEDA